MGLDWFGVRSFVAALLLSAAHPLNLPVNIPVIIPIVIALLIVISRPPHFLGKYSTESK